jgi:TonB family protein
MKEVRMHLRAPLVVLFLVAPLGLNAQQPTEAVPANSASPAPSLIDSACLVPVHPQILREAGIEGRVLVGFVVDTTGAVEPSTVRVLSSSHKLFEAPARAAVSTCRYVPGRAAGRPVRVRMQQAVNFELPAPPPRPR